MLSAVAYAQVQVVVDLCNQRTPQAIVGKPEHTRAVLLQQALSYMPSPQPEHMMRNVACKIGQILKGKVRHDIILLIIFCSNCVMCNIHVED